MYYTEFTKVKMMNKPYNSRNKTKLYNMKKLLLITCLAYLYSFLGAQNQSELLKNFSSKSVIPGAVVDGKIIVKPKEWPITIESQNGIINKIILMRAGILEEIYQPDVPSYSTYFYSATNRLCFINGVFAYYKMNNGTPDILYVLAESVDKIEKTDFGKLKTALTDYFTVAGTEQKSAKENLKEDLAALKEKEKLANSIKGKNIKNVEIVWLTNESQTGMQAKIQFGVKATDTNGKIYSTDNLGGKTSWEDFDISSKGAVYGDEYLTVETDASKIINDAIQLTVKCKHNPTISANSSIKLAYVTPVKISYPGKYGCPPLTSGTGTSGGRAQNAVLDVCNSKDNLFVLIEVKIGGVSLHKIKLKKGVPFYLDVTGGGGCSGRSEKSSQGGKGGNGGDGGNVTLNKNSKLDGENITIYNSGGRGGKGGKGNPFDGPSGSNGADGFQNTNTTSVNLNF